jgi:hypothetical protein
MQTKQIGNHTGIFTGNIQLFSIPTASADPFCRPIDLPFYLEIAG